MTLFMLGAASGIVTAGILRAIFAATDRAATRRRDHLIHEALKEPR